MPIGTTSNAPPVSLDRVRECEESARFWAVELGPFANRMNDLADRYALWSAGLSALTGLGVWSTLVASTLWPVVVLVSAVAVASAVVAMVPRVKGYGDRAKAAASLAPRYGNVLGELIDVRQMFEKNNPDAPAVAKLVVERFESLKREKDTVKGVPVRAASPKKS